MTAIARIASAKVRLLRPQLNFLILVSWSVGCSPSFSQRIQSLDVAIFRRDARLLPRGNFYVVAIGALRINLG